MEKISGDDCYKALDLKDHILFYFTANWCKPCQVVAPLMEAMGLEYQNQNVKFYKVDIDDEDNSELCKQCEIKQVPVFLLFKDRNFIDKVLGGNIDKIKELINNNLNKQETKQIFNKDNLIQNKELPNFFPSKYFQGKKDGYVFKTDQNGLGYYLDKKM
jgi:thioredoxin 1